MLSAAELVRKLSAHSPRPAAETPSPRDATWPAQIAQLQPARFTGKDQRRIFGKLRLDGGQRGRISIVGHLDTRFVAPIWSSANPSSPSVSPISGRMAHGYTKAVSAKMTKQPKKCDTATITIGSGAQDFSPPLLECASVKVAFGANQGTVRCRQAHGDRTPDRRSSRARPVKPRRFVIRAARQFHACSVLRLERGRVACRIANQHEPEKTLYSHGC